MKDFTQQATELQAAQDKLDAVHLEYHEKFVELKELYETKEKRRLTEMVESNATKTQGYEERIKNLQHQLADTQNPAFYYIQL